MSEGRGRGMRGMRGTRGMRGGRGRGGLGRGALNLTPTIQAKEEEEEDFKETKPNLDDGNESETSSETSSDTSSSSSSSSSNTTESDSNNNEKTDTNTKKAQPTTSTTDRADNSNTITTKLYKEDYDNEPDSSAEETRARRKTLFKDSLEKGRFWYMKGRPGRLSHRKLCWCVLDREAYQIRCYDMSMKVVSCIDLRLAKEPELCESVKKGRYPVVFSSEHTHKSFTLEAETEERQRQLHAQAQQVIREMDPPDQEMIQMFLDADDDGSFTLEFNEVKRLLTRRGVQISVPTMRDKFDDVDYDRNGSLDFGEFEQLEHNIQHDKDVEKIFKRYAAGQGARYISRRRFAKFLMVEQGESVDEKRLDALMAKYKAAVKVLPKKIGSSSSSNSSSSSSKEGEKGETTDKGKEKGKGKDKKRPLTKAELARIQREEEEAAAAAAAERRLEAENREIMEGDALDLKGFTAFLRSAEDNPSMRSATSEDDNADSKKKSKKKKDKKKKKKKKGDKKGDDDDDDDNNDDEDDDSDDGDGKGRDLGRPLAQYLICACSDPCKDASTGFKDSDPLEVLGAGIAANCRFYELCALGRNGDVVFGHKGGKYIDVRVALGKLKELLARDSSTPLIIALELVNCTPPEQEKLLALFDSVFGKDILPSQKVITTTTTTTTTTAPQSPPKSPTQQSSPPFSFSSSSSASAQTAQLMSPASMGGKVILMLRRTAIEGGGDNPPPRISPEEVKRRGGYSVRPDDPEEDSGGGEDSGTVITPALARRAGLLQTTFLGVTKGKRTEFLNARGGTAAADVITLRASRAAFFSAPTNVGLLREYSSAMLVRNYALKEAFPMQRLCCTGAQIVPTSFATRKNGLDSTALIAREFFRGRGMVPKPAWLNTANGIPPAAEAVTLQVTIINARQLPKVGREAAVDPYVTATVLGFDRESSPCGNPYISKSEAFVTKATNKTGLSMAELAGRVNREQQTRTIKNNGWDPSWNTVFEFTLYAPALDVLMITVKDKDFGVDDFIGFAALPCNLMRMGYRTLRLMDSFGNELPFAHLFCHFAVVPIKVAESKKGKSGNAGVTRTSPKPPITPPLKLPDSAPLSSSGN